MYANALHPYPAYKPSGVPWLGDVPEHWDVRRLGETNASIVSGAWGSDPNGSSNDTACVRVADFDRMWLRVKKNNLTLRHIESADLAKRSLTRGDLLLEKSGGGELQPVGAVVLYDSAISAVCTNFVARLRVADGFISKYLLALHFALYAMRINVRSIKQTTGIQNLDLASYFNELVPIPPFPEQNAIVRYLDHVDRRIRRYVSAKRKLIALLEEERQAVVNRAVTRGLDSNVRLKPSGVEWLGDVPEHWEIARFSRQINIAEGQVDPTVEPYASMPLIAPNHLEARTGRLLNQETASEQGAISSKYLCRAGDVIYSKIRPALAKVVVAPIDCLCSADMYPLSPRHSLQANYLFWLLLSTAFTAWSVLESDRVAMPKINRATLKSYHLPIPPLSEQAAIVRHLDEAATNIYTATDSARRQIELVEEYRTRLIADVVTGKVDVREAAAQLPDEAGDQDLIEEREPLANSLPRDLYDIDEAVEDSVTEEEVTI